MSETPHTRTPYALDNDQAYYDDQLGTNSPRLFNDSERGGIEMLHTRGPGGSLSEDNAARLTSQVSEEVAEDLIYIISQEYTWGHLLVTVDDFRSLLFRYRVFDTYISYLQAFGWRETDEERSRSPYAWQKARNAPFDEFCYNVKYVARNGRPDRNPWSIRQVGIYERLDVETGQSVWIVMQPSDHVRKRLGDGLDTKSEGFLHAGTEEKLVAQTMTVHASVLIAAGREWGLYLEDLRFQVQKMDKEAIYTSVGKVSMHSFDFSITFERRQKVQQCRNKLSLALHALDIAIEICEGCRSRLNYLAHTSDTRASKQATKVQTLQDRFEWHLTDLKNHKQAALSIIDQCSWTAALQEKILEYRNDETMQAHGQALRDLAAAQKGEAQNVTDLTRQTAQDSKLLKTLTVMATLYLPASLLASIFNSNLIQVAQPGSSDRVADTHFVLAHDFWIYVVITIPLTASTVLLVTWMRRRAKMTR